MFDMVFFLVFIDLLLVVSDIYYKIFSVWTVARLVSFLTADTMTCIVWLLDRHDTNDSPHTKKRKLMQI